ncbi:unnamed protein product [Meloidogyne enterolobii]|uniref:Uncharacterized protein n=3 Tax=Meloidogyne enterolobii TaxID=390850 RepID=A0A6V7XHM4_MELEN|nr:unnamed protein product [Meloidogyne enterolobii]
MKLFYVLSILIFHSILWCLINSVKNNKNQQELKRADGTLVIHEKSNDRAESSFAPQIEKYGEMLNPTPTITKKEINKNKEEEKRLKKKECNRNHYQKNKEKRKQYNKNYRQNNKDKRKEYLKNYYQENKEEKLEYGRKYWEKNKERISERKKYTDHEYYLKNKEKKREYDRMRRQKNNQKVICKNGILKVKKVESDNYLGTSINPQTNNCENKGKDQIICEEYGQINNSEGNSLVNSTYDCVNNLSGSIVYPVGEGNAQTADSNVVQQSDGQNDVFDLSFLEDPEFLNNLNS